MRAAICKSGKVRAAELSGAQPSAVDTPANAVYGGELTAFDMSEGRSIAKDRSGVDRDTDGPFFRELTLQKQPMI